MNYLQSILRFSGSGELLRVTLLTPEQCRSGPLRRVALPGKGDTKTPANIKNIPGAIATAAASVDVDFSGGDAPQRPDTPQNDDIMARGGIRSGMAELGDILKGIILFPIKLILFHKLAQNWQWQPDHIDR